MSDQNSANYFSKKSSANIFSPPNSTKHTSQNAPTPKQSTVDKLLLPKKRESAPVVFSRESNQSCEAGKRINTKSFASNFDQNSRKKAIFSLKQKTDSALSYGLLIKNDLQYIRDSKNCSMKAKLKLLKEALASKNQSFIISVLMILNESLNKPILTKHLMNTQLFSSMLFSRMCQQVDIDAKYIKNKSTNLFTLLQIEKYINTRSYMEFPTAKKEKILSHNSSGLLQTLLLQYIFCLRTQNFPEYVTTLEKYCQGLRINKYASEKLFIGKYFKKLSEINDILSIEKKESNIFINRWNAFTNPLKPSESLFIYFLAVKAWHLKVQASLIIPLVKKLNQNEDQINLYRLIDAKDELIDAIVKSGNLLELAMIRRQIAPTDALHSKIDLILNK